MNRVAEPVRCGRAQLVCKLVLRRRRCSKFKSESPGLLASATLSAIARLTIVHRAILTSLLTARLVRCETHCANRGCQERKQDFEMILHKRTVACDHRES
jgi:hypothetical protein